MFEFPAAMSADVLTALHGLLIICSIVSGFMWLYRLVEHFSFKPTLPAAAFSIFCVVAAVWLGGKIDMLREISPAFEPGKASILMIWLFAGIAVICSPLLMMIASCGCKRKAG